MIDLDVEKATAFALASQGDTEGLAKWVTAMNESGQRRQATAILEEIVAHGMASVVDHLK